VNIYCLVDDSSSWIVPHAVTLCNKITDKGHKAKLVFNQSDISQCDVAFYLGCTSIVKRSAMDKANSNIVVHPSDLPKGRGFSPIAWQVLEGKNIITVTLFEATEKVDNGDVYFRGTINLDGTELNNEIKEKQGGITVDLCLKYIQNYGNCLRYKQEGDSTYYQRRTISDSQIDPHKTIADQFELLRVVDNERYPAFFRYRDSRYTIKIYKDKEKNVSEKER
jgi:methionyl-tRNA formyltransferase